MSDQVDAARKAFGIRLRDLRKDARLTGLELFARSGIHNSRISRIENGRQDPSEADIRAWAAACGADGQIPELIAAHRQIEQMWVEWHRELRAGMRHVQARALPLYERTRLLRAYESVGVPGILQTRGYVRAVMEAVGQFHELTEDPDEATDARLARQRLMTSGTHLYSFVLEAAALGFVIGDAEVMHEQLDFLSAVTFLPNVALGIIPPGRPRKIWPGEGFYIFDDQLVRSEMWTGGYRSSRPEEIAIFARVFTLLHEQAVYGTAARGLIETARAALQNESNT